MSTKKRDLSVEIKARKRRQTHRTFVFDATMNRLHKLHSLSETEFGRSEEFSRYIPKAVVAALQGFLRSAWGNILDLGEPHLSQIAKYLKDKSKVTFDFVTVREIAEKKLTLGEFVAHTLSFNNFEDVTEAFNAILDSKFLEILKKQSYKDGTPILEDEKLFFEKMDALFRERHIFSHELADNYHLSRNDALIFIKVAEQLVEGVQQIFSLETSKKPNCQQDMNRYARKKANEAQKIVEEQVNLILEALRSKSDYTALEKYIKANEAWQEYAKLEADVYSDQCRGGTLAPLLSASIYEYLTKQRIQTLEKWFDFLLSSPSPH